MKVNMTVDLTPEEARTLFGLPQIESLQKEMVELMREKMLENMEKTADPEFFFKTVFPAGQQGMEQFQKMFAEFASKSSTNK